MIALNRVLSLHRNDDLCANFPQRASTPASALSFLLPSEQALNFAASVQGFFLPDWQKPIGPGGAKASLRCYVLLSAQLMSTDTLVRRIRPRAIALGYLWNWRRELSPTLLSPFCLPFAINLACLVRLGRCAHAPVTNLDMFVRLI